MTDSITLPGTKRLLSEANSLEPPYKNPRLNELEENEDREISPFTRMPNELWHYIFSFLDPIRDIPNIGLTCKVFRQIASDNELWKIWCKSHFSRDISQNCFREFQIEYNLRKSNCSAHLISHYLEGEVDSMDLEGSTLSILSRNQTGELISTLINLDPQIKFYKGSSNPISRFVFNVKESAVFNGKLFLVNEGIFQDPEDTITAVQDIKDEDPITLTIFDINKRKSIAKRRVALGQITARSWFFPCGDKVFFLRNDNHSSTLARASVYDPTLTEELGSLQLPYEVANVLVRKEDVILITKDSSLIFDPFTTKPRCLQLDTHGYQIIPDQFQTQGNKISGCGKQGESTFCLIWDLETGKTVEQIEINNRPMKWQKYAIKANFLHVVSKKEEEEELGTYKIWDLEMGKRIHKMQIVNLNLTDCIFNEDKCVLLINDSCEIWDLNTCSQLNANEIKVEQMLNHPDMEEVIFSKIFYKNGRLITVFREDKISEYTCSLNFIEVKDFRC